MEVVSLCDVKCKVALLKYHTIGWEVTVVTYNTHIQNIHTKHLASPQCLSCWSPIIVNNTTCETHEHVMTYHMFEHLRYVLIFVDHSGLILICTAAAFLCVISVTFFTHIIILADFS